MMHPDSNIYCMEFWEISRNYNRNFAKLFCEIQNYFLQIKCFAKFFSQLPYTRGECNCPRWQILLFLCFWQFCKKITRQKIFRKHCFLEVFFLAPNAIPLSLYKIGTIRSTTFCLIAFGAKNRGNFLLCPDHTASQHDYKNK